VVKSQIRFSLRRPLGALALRRGWIGLGVCAAALVMGGRGPLRAADRILDFDSIPLAAGDCVDASAYLATYGITFASVGGAASSAICSSIGSAVTPTSGTNVFYGLPAVTNTDEAFDLVFDKPLDRVMFGRAQINPLTALPPWGVSAYDASGNVLSSISRGLAYPGPPAEQFTLTGPGIVRVRFEAFNSAHVTFNFPPIDDLILDSKGFGRVHVWLNAFIPGDLPFLRFPRTRLAPRPYLGQTMMTGPFPFLGPFNPYFLTDQRWFSPDPGASSRMHSAIEIDVDSLAIVGQAMGIHRTDFTTELLVLRDPVTLEPRRAITECHQRADRDRMRFSGLRAVAGSPIEIHLWGESNNPCLPSSPDIDYRGTITIDAAAETVSFDGFVDEFPAFEMYASVDGGPAKSIFVRSPELGKNPWNLWGGPNVHVTGSANFRGGS
jgi:Protein of unknown function (DUF3238)